MSVKFHALRVSAVVRETADCHSFELDVPPALRDAFRYKAGQHLTFRFPWDGFTVTRCYSLSSCPDTDEALRIAVKRVDGGRVSNWMNDNLGVGDVVRASVPEGRFVLDPETRATAPLFLFAGGSGITPVISLAKSALRTTRRAVTLVYANQNSASVIYAEEIDKLARDYPERFQVVHHLDDDAGHITGASLRRHLRHTDIAEFYICGPEPFMELVERTLTEAGVHEELMYIERFVSPADPDRAEASAASEPGTFDAPASFSLWLNGRSRTVPYAHGKTLLQCAHDAGLQPPHS